MTADRAIAATRPSPDASAFVAAGHWTGETIDAALARTAARAPDAPALAERDRRLSYGELQDCVERGAGMLRELGVRRGDVVTYQLPNRLEAAIVHHATARLGAIGNPVIPIYRERELRFILERSRSRVLVVPDVFRGFEHRAMAAEVAAGLPELAATLVVGEPLDGQLAFARALQAASPAPAAPGRTGADLALLLYTSGTESDPKGVLHSHDTLTYECRSIIELYALSDRDAVFMPSPVTHVTGLLYGLTLPAMLGVSCTLQDVWDPARAMALIERDRLSFTVAATPFLHGIVHHERRGDFDLTSLRVFVCGGADVPPGLIRAAREQLGVLASRVYGSSECPTATGTPLHAPEDRQIATDGRAIAATQVRVLDPDGLPAAPGEPGEVQIRGPELFLGYLDPALNETAFTDDGWFRTGDLARIDADGWVTIAGREKDVILRGGENLSAKEIEDLVVEHPAVRDVAIVGYPDPVLGERACAVVVAAAPLTLDELVSFLRARRIAAQKLPERLLVVDELPTTASGKVQKFHLREALRVDGSPAAGAG